MSIERQRLAILELVAEKSTCEDFLALVMLVPRPELVHLAANALDRETAGADGWDRFIQSIRATLGPSATTGLENASKIDVITWRTAQIQAIGLSELASADHPLSQLALSIVERYGVEEDVLDLAPLALKRCVPDTMAYAPIGDSLLDVYLRVATASRVSRAWHELMGQLDDTDILRAIELMSQSIDEVGLPSSNLLVPLPVL
jgi:hypothetical protein